MLRREAALYEFFEDARAQLVWNADPLIDYVDADEIATPACAEDNAARWCVAKRIGDQIAHNAFQQHRIAIDRDAAFDQPEAQAVRGGLRREVRVETREERLQQ